MPQDVWWGYWSLFSLPVNVHVESLGETIAKVVGSAALQSLAVVHHRLDGIGGLHSAGEFFTGRSCGP